MTIEQKNKYKFFFIIYGTLLIVAAFFRFPDIRNELKYFVITDQMLNSKNFFILKYFNELYPDKPPIYFWILGILRYYFKGEFYSLGLIFGGIIPGGIIAYLTFKLTKLFWNEKMAYISTGIFITFPYLFGIALVLRMDYLMSMFIIGSLYIFFKGYKENSLNKIQLIKIYLCISLGILSKGGAAFVVPFLTIIFYLWINRDLKFLKKLNIPLGLGIIFGIFLVWFLFILRETDGRSYIKLLIGRETVGRVIKSKIHVRPFYYYLRQAPLTTLPSSPFFIWGIYKKLKDIKNIVNWKEIDKISFSLFFPNLIFFSLLSGKLDIYLLPLYYGIVIISLRSLESSRIKNSIYNWILRINISVFIISILGLGYYNNNYTLKPILKILKKNKDKNIFLFKFQDGKNITFELNKNKILEELVTEKIENIPKGSLILTREKYLNRIPKENIKIIFKNKMYSIVEKETP